MGEGVGGWMRMAVLERGMEKNKGESRRLKISLI